MARDFEEPTKTFDTIGRPEVKLQKPGGQTGATLRRASPWLRPFSANSRPGFLSGRVAEEIGHRGQFEAPFPQFLDHPGEGLGGVPAAAIGVHDEDRAVSGPALHRRGNLFGRHPGVRIPGHHIPLDDLDPSSWRICRVRTPSYPKRGAKKGPGAAGDQTEVGGQSDPGRSRGRWLIGFGAGPPSAAPAHPHPYLKREPPGKRPGPEDQKTKKPKYRIFTLHPPAEIQLFPLPSELISGALADFPRQYNDKISFSHLRAACRSRRLAERNQQPVTLSPRFKLRIAEPLTALSLSSRIRTTLFLVAFSTLFALQQR